MINSFGELFDILSDSGGLFCVEELAYEQFFLIVVESIMKKATKGLPIREIKLGFNGLKPMSRSTIEMLFGNTNPHRRRNTICLEIISVEGAPVTRIVTIKTRE